MTVYYAHPINIYGTVQEHRDIFLLEALGLTVVNPNVPELAAAYKERGMDVFLEQVEKCDWLAFRAFPDGSIPAGVAQEIIHAHSAGVKVIELPSAVARRALSVDATRAYLREAGHR